MADKEDRENEEGEREETTAENCGSGEAEGGCGCGGEAAGEVLGEEDAGDRAGQDAEAGGAGEGKFEVRNQKFEMLGAPGARFME